MVRFERRYLFKTGIGIVIITQAEQAGPLVVQGMGVFGVFLIVMLNACSGGKNELEPSIATTSESEPQLIQTEDSSSKSVASFWNSNTRIIQPNVPSSFWYLWKPF